jgi:hypothetical protein
VGISIPFRLTDDQLRAMYAGGRADASARRYARFWTWMFAAGLAPGRWVTLEVPGRVSGRPTRFPLGYADLDGERYLVPMLGGDCNWVKNVRAAGGLATIKHLRSIPCHLIEVPVDHRAPILRRYVQQVPGCRPHMPVSADDDLVAFEAIAADYPTFRIERVAR